MGTIDDLRLAVSGLTPIQIDLLIRMANGMRGLIAESITPGSDILVPRFVANFSNRLRMHHATNREKFKKKSFEYAFLDASSAAEKKAVINDDPTNPGADVIVDGVAFSLKTEASTGISTKTIVISKLMEARWIRECVTPENFARGTTARVTAHLRKYNRILMLRAFDIEKTKIRYDMVEIPLDLLLQVENLKPADFSPRTTNGGSHADVYVGGKKAFSLRLDGSVEKVTISNLQVGMCRTHGSWIVQTFPSG
jgi:hypothetical protein